MLSMCNERTELLNDFIQVCLLLKRQQDQQSPKNNCAN